MLGGGTLEMLTVPVFVKKMDSPSLFFCISLYFPKLKKKAYTSFGMGKYGKRKKTTKK